MDLEKILAVTVSGVRSEEETSVKTLLNACHLHTDDLNADKLRHFIVARKGDAVVGVVGLEIVPPHALLRSLAVSEAHRGQGIGTQLVEAVERYARLMGVTTLYLLTMTAENFLNRCEFLKTSRHEAPASLQALDEFKTLCPETAVCMCKKIVD